MTAAPRARKRFGQNFLRDELIVRRIAAAIHPTARQHLVEIGPGRGAITGALLASGCRLDVIELDRDLVPRLQQQFAAHDKLRIHQADALHFDFSRLSQAGEPLRLVGNLPYNIATTLLFRLLEYTALIEDMHFMLQLEVAHRLAAKPGGKTWGRLGAMAQYYCRVEALFEVPPDAFKPTPAVQSALVRLQPHPHLQRDPAAELRLRQTLRAAFAQRRKTLRNNLRHLLDMQKLQSLDISPDARAETLSLQQLIAISALLPDRTAE